MLFLSVPMQGEHSASNDQLNKQNFTSSMTSVSDFPRCRLTSADAMLRSTQRGSGHSVT